jgi:phosphoribosylamine--glycine ligase
MISRALKTIIRVLVIGKDARTDAIAAACLASSQRIELYAVAEMLSPGLVEKCQRVIIRPKLDDARDLKSIVDEIRPDLVIIGPEEPLAAGYVDALQGMGIPAFGPPKSLARIESSKAWARDLVRNHNIPGNPDYRVLTSGGDVRKYMEELGSFVVKPDGLTAGKGVRVFGEHFHAIDQALAYAEQLIAVDGQVQIEQRLDGEEFSLQTITDGESVVHCPAVQDHKRAEAGDRGPNTGGMGSYSCRDFSLPFLEPVDLRQAQSINEQVIDALARETGQPYRGVLYGGFIATGDGVRLIEYNSRFGDPEALNVLPILEADFFELCLSVANGELGRVPVSFASKATVCKYIVPSAYPEHSDEPGEIHIPEPLLHTEGLKWYWAACEQQGERVRLTQSRSGAFVGIAESLEAAEALADAAAKDVERGSPVRHRADIGRREVIDKRIRHMESLRALRGDVEAASQRRKSQHPGRTDRLAASGT